MSRPLHPARRKSLSRPDPVEELERFKQALAQARQLRLEREAEQRALAAQLENERMLFSRSVGIVQPLRRLPTAPLPREPAQAIPRQRELDEAAVLHEAISDEFDVETLLETDDTLSYRRSDIGVAVLRKLRRGVWTIQAELDLHGLRRDEAREALAAFMRRAVRERLRCVRVVHGKGNGSPGREPVLKAKVKSWLVQRQEVIAFVQARPTDGGHGALVVLLSPTQNRSQGSASLELE
ncbi:MAG: Smr/MutS family protein [Ideonella sp.]